MATAVSNAPLRRRSQSLLGASRARPALVEPDAEARKTGRSSAPGGYLRVSELQRSRLLAAASQVACECGAANATVAQVVKRAGVSRRTFYELFEDCEECVLAALQDALERVRERVLAAWSVASGKDWRTPARMTLAALLELFDEDPVLARLLVVESLGAGRLVLEERGRVLDGVIDALDRESRGDAADPRSRVPAGKFSRMSMEGAVGGALGVLHARIAKPTTESLLDLTGPLMGMLVLPRHGSAAARRELERPAPLPAFNGEGAQRSASLPLSDPFKAAGMRLTYRTMRVLCAIGERPNSSNRVVAGLAGVGDQGQVSKLLARLERAGMIANAGGSSPGDANAWRLTAPGGQVVDRVGPRTPRAAADAR